jgi:hypothetical protein
MNKMLAARTVSSAALAFALTCALSTAFAQTAPAAAYKAPRLQGTNRPNLSGLWQSMNEGNWDLQAHEAQPGPLEFGALYAQPAGPGIVEGNDIPYKPEALAKKKENHDKRLVRTLADGVRFEPLDPEAKCYLPGVPRATYMPFPFQIIQGDKKIVIAYPFASASRIIPLSDPGPAPTDSYMGWSWGRWEGDTLVVDVTGFNDKTWFDRAGNFHSEALHVVERYTPVSADVINYEATIEDPQTFTRPWKIAFPLYRRQEKNAQFLEFKCQTFAEDLLYGHLRKK